MAFEEKIPDIEKPKGDEKEKKGGGRLWVKKIRWRHRMVSTGGWSLCLVSRVPLKRTEKKPRNSK